MPGKGVFSISLNGKDMAYNMVYIKVYVKKNNQYFLFLRI